MSFAVVQVAVVNLSGDRSPARLLSDEAVECVLVTVPESQTAEMSLAVFQGQCWGQGA